MWHAPGFRNCRLSILNEMFQNLNHQLYASEMVSIVGHRIATGKQEQSSESNPKPASVQLTMSLVFNPLTYIRGSNIVLFPVPPTRHPRLRQVELPLQRAR